jgi:hypothetical protein
MLDERLEGIAMKATHITVGVVFLVTLSMGGGAIAAKPPASSGSGWSAATAISPVGQPDPTRGSQLNDVAVNANGFAIAAWDLGSVGKPRLFIREERNAP